MQGLWNALEIYPRVDKSVFQRLEIGKTPPKKDEREGEGKNMSKEGMEGPQGLVKTAKQGFGKTHHPYGV